MTDPMNTASNDSFRDGGLNASDLSASDMGGAHKSDVAKMTRMFLLFMIPFAVMLVVLLGAFAWKLTNKPGMAAMPVASAPTVASDKDAQIAQLQSQLLRLQSQAQPSITPGTVAPGTVAPPAPAYSADAAAIAQLSARIDRLEANQRVLAHAASAATAASALQLKAHTSAPFIVELAAVEPAFADPSLTAPLRAIAERGVPSEVELAIDFPAAAARANIAAKAASDDDSLINRAKHVLGSFVSVRRTDNVTGHGTEAKLRQAETRLNAGDLDGALAYLASLPAPAQTALKPWMDKARARSLVDSTTHHITQLALDRLVQANDGLPAAGGVQ